MRRNDRVRHLKDGRNGTVIRVSRPNTMVSVWWDGIGCPKWSWWDDVAKLTPLEALAECAE